MSWHCAGGVRRRTGCPVARVRAAGDALRRSLPGDDRLQPAATPGETYSGPLHFVRYLLTFPVQHARVDALWLLGGAGCAVLLAAAARDRESPDRAGVGRSRLPDDCDQRQPRPAAVFRAGAARAGARRRVGGDGPAGARRRLVNVARRSRSLAVAVWRVNEFPKLAGNIVHDARYAARPDDARGASGALRRSRDAEVLGAGDGANSASSSRQRTAPDEPIYIFGFACGAYVKAERASASRFFWSRPVIVGFNAAKPGYGVERAARRSRTRAAGDRRAAGARLGARRRRTRPQFFMTHAARSPTGCARTTNTSPVRPASRSGRAAGSANERDGADRTCPGGSSRSRSLVILAGRRPPARPLSGRRSALEPHGRHRLARRRRVGPQRAQQGAVRRVDAWTRGTRCSSRRCSPALEYAVVRSASVSASARRGWSRRSSAGSRCCCSALGVGRIAGRRAGLIAGGAARDQLRLRDVEPGRADGRADGRLHGRVAGTAMRAPRPSPAGAGAPAAFALARLLHQGGGRVLRRGARRSMRCVVLVVACAGRIRVDAAAPALIDAGRTRDLAALRGARAVRAAELDGLPVLQLCRCRSRASRATTSSRSSNRVRGSRSSTTCSRGCGSRSRSGSPRRSACSRAGGSAAPGERLLGCGSCSAPSSCSCTTSATSAASCSSSRRWSRWRRSCSAAIGRCCRPTVGIDPARASAARRCRSCSTRCTSSSGRSSGWRSSTRCAPNVRLGRGPGGRG